MVGAFENLNLNLECYGQTNPEGQARLTRRLIMDLVRIVIFVTEYSMILEVHSGRKSTIVLRISERQQLSSPYVDRSQVSLLTPQGCMPDRRTEYGLPSKLSA